MAAAYGCLRWADAWGNLLPIFAAPPAALLTALLVISLINRRVGARTRRALRRLERRRGPPG